MKKIEYDALRENVFGFKTKHPLGFTYNEIRELLAVCYENIDFSQFCDRLGVVTCISVDGETVIYHRDVWMAIMLCLENRDAYDYEFD